MTHAKALTKILENPPSGVTRKEWEDWLIKTIPPFVMGQIALNLSLGQTTLKTVVQVLGDIKNART